MKKFLLLLITLFLTGGVFLSVGAQEEETCDLTKDMFMTWNGDGADAVSTGVANVDFNIGNDAVLSGGNMVCGTGSVLYLTYADLTGYTKMIINGDAGLPLRVLMNRQDSNSGPLVERQPVIGSDGKVELDLSEFTFVHVNAIKVNWGPTSGKVSSIKLVKPADPLAFSKQTLKNAIDDAKLRSSYAKTESSWNALTTAVTAGENELKNAAATAESLAAAQQQIDVAINGLTLQDGYTNLTADMFLKYSSVDNPGEGSAVGCAYDVRKSTGQPYGDGSVGELNWADLTEYDKLIVVTAGDIKPRFCMNRLVHDGQQAATQEESNLIDINPNNSFTWSTEAYQTVEGNAYIIDLNAIVDDYGFARLHAIKKQGWGDGVIVTDMLLYKEPVVEETDVTITMPEGYDDRTYSDEVALDFSTAEGLTAYIIVDVVEGRTILKEVTKVPANTGLYLVGKAGATYTVSVIKDFQSDEFKDNLLKSTINGVQKTEDGKTNYMLGVTSAGRGFHMLKKSGSYEQTKNKAYLSYAVDEANAPERLFIGEGEANRIANINVEKANGAWYTINGVKLNGVPTQKGMYIRNGKTIMIK